MAALVAAFAGLEPHVLGTDTPVEEIVAAFKARRSAAIGISISVSTAGAALARSARAAAPRDPRGGRRSSSGAWARGAAIRRAAASSWTTLQGMLDWMRRLAVARVRGAESDRRSAAFGEDLPREVGGRLGEERDARAA